MLNDNWKGAYLLLKCSMLQNWKILNSAALESKAFANLLTYLRKGTRQGLVLSSLVPHAYLDLYGNYFSIKDF